MVFIWTWVLDKSEALMKPRSTDCGGRTLEHLTKCPCVIFYSRKKRRYKALAAPLGLVQTELQSIMVSCDGKNVSIMLQPA